MPGTGSRRVIHELCEFELCQELYDLSGWLTGMDGYYYVSPTGKGTGFEVRTLTDTENDRARVFPPTTSAPCFEGCRLATFLPH